jgi:uncharacterized protein YkwD
MKAIILTFAIAVGCQAQSLGKQFVAAHNAARAKVGVGPVVWSEKLAAHAQQWADTLLVTGKFEHRRKHIYGENLFEIEGARATPAEVVKNWVSEARDYDYRSNTCHGVCGHYTQVVWRNTKAVGCAVARNPGREVWVCNYDPPGNWIGERPY